MPVKIGTNTINNIMPLIKTKTALAFEIPFLDARNKHTTSGNKNKTITISYLNCIKILANAPIILETSNDAVLSIVKVTGSGIVSVYKRTKPMATNEKYDDINKIFFLLDKSNNAIKGRVIGKSPTDNGCENTAGIKEIADKEKILKTKYIESR